MYTFNYFFNINKYQTTNKNHTVTNLNHFDNQVPQNYNPNTPHLIKNKNIHQIKLTPILHIIKYLTQNTSILQTKYFNKKLIKLPTINKKFIPMKLEQIQNHNIQNKIHINHTYIHKKSYTNHIIKHDFNNDNNNLHIDKTSKLKPKIQPKHRDPHFTNYNTLYKQNDTTNLDPYLIYK